MITIMGVHHHRCWIKKMVVVIIIVVSKTHDDVFTSSFFVCMKILSFAGSGIKEKLNNHDLPPLFQKNLYRRLTKCFRVQAGFVKPL